MIYKDNQAHLAVVDIVDVCHGFKELQLSEMCLHATHLTVASRL